MSLYLLNYGIGNNYIILDGRVRKNNTIEMMLPLFNFFLAILYPTVSIAININFFLFFEAVIYSFIRSLLSNFFNISNKYILLYFINRYKYINNDIIII
jgi:hypothetical protein